MAVVVAQLEMRANVTTRIGGMFDWCHISIFTGGSMIQNKDPHLLNIRGFGMTGDLRSSRAAAGDFARE